MDTDRKISVIEKWALVINGTTGTFHGQMVQIFLLFYYTDLLGIAPSFVAGLFLGVRIINALLAPVMGIIIDKINTPWGKYKPWYILSGVLVSIMGCLTFTDLGLGETGTIIYISITYFLYHTAKTLGSAPGSALGPAVTKSVADRVSMAQMGFVMVMVAAISVQVLIQPLYSRLGAGDGSKGFSIIMAFVGILGILVALFQGRVIKERYISKPSRDEKSPTVIEMLKMVFENKTAMIVYGYSIAILLSTSIRSATTIYYLKYYFNQESLMVVSGLVSMVPLMLGVMLSGRIVKRVGIKKTLVTASMINIITTLLVFFVPANSIGIFLYIILMCVGSLFMGIGTPAQGTLMPAAMDYTEWRTGKNVNAFMGSISGFIQSIGYAISGALVPFVLASFGYVSSAQTQSASAILGLRLLMGIIPSFVMLLTLIVVKYDLNEEQQCQITRDLSMRHALKQQEGVA